jgi:hypothetical protein
VDELATMLSWRQRFLAEGMLAKGKMRDPGELIHWARESSEFFRNYWVVYIFRICPIITIILVVTGFVMNIIPWYLTAAALVLQFGLLSYKKKDRYWMFSIVENYADDLKVYYILLNMVGIKVPPFYAFFRVIIPVAVYTSLLTPLFFRRIFRFVQLRDRDI